MPALPRHRQEQLGRLVRTAIRARRSGQADLGSSNVTIGSLTFNGSVNMTITSSAGGVLIFDGGSGSAGMVTSLGGTHVISAPVLLNNGLGITSEPANVTFSGVLSGAGQLSPLGGTVILTNSNTYSGGTTIVAGALQLGDGVSSNGSVVGNIATAGH